MCKTVRMMIFASCVVCLASGIGVAASAVNAARERIVLKTIAAQERAGGSIVRVYRTVEVAPQSIADGPDILPVASLSDKTASPIEESESQGLIHRIPQDELPPPGEWEACYDNAGDCGIVAEAICRDRGGVIRTIYQADPPDGQKPCAFECSNGESGTCERDTP